MLFNNAGISPPDDVSVLVFPGAGDRNIGGIQILDRTCWYLTDADRDN